MKDEYCFMVGDCINCQKVITFNPKYVPSLRVPPKNKREPLCRNCANKWNQIHRTSKGLQPQEIHKDAYKPININKLYEGE